MTVTVYNSGEFRDPISEVREPNIAQDHNGNTINVYKSGLFGPYSLHIDNHEVRIEITHTSATNLINELIYHRDLRMKLLEDFYADHRCREIWNDWNKIWNNRKNKRESTYND